MGHRAQLELHPGTLQRATCDLPPATWKRAAAVCAVRTSREASAHRERKATSSEIIAKVPATSSGSNSLLRVPAGTQGNSSRFLTVGSPAKTHEVPAGTTEWGATRCVRDHRRGFAQFVKHVHQSENSRRPSRCRLTDAAGWSKFHELGSFHAPNCTSSEFEDPLPLTSRITHHASRITHHSTIPIKRTQAKSR
jgi:hypothetical protein